MARQPRARKPSGTEKASGSNLLEVLKFIAVSQHNEGTLLQTHCRISNKSVIGFDGGIAAGHFVDEVLSCCPHTWTLIAALSKCTDAISVTQLDSGRLSVKSGKFRALIPCIEFDDLPAIEPDPPTATLTDAVKSALAAVAPLAQDSAPDPFMCAVLLHANTAAATNRAVILEAWHGVDLPRILLPKASVNAICKQTKSLTGFGFSENSATFYFQDNSFIKTQLFNDTFPNYEKLLNVESNAWPLPSGFYEALEKVSSFSENKAVFFRDGRICSHPTDDKGASFAVEGLTDGLAFNSDYLKLIRQHAHNMQFNADDRGMALFFGDNVRGAIMKVNF